MEKYFMRHLLYPVLLLFLLLCCTGTSFSAVVQHLPQKGESALHAYTVAEDDKSGKHWKPIHIEVSAEGVNNVLRDCDRKRALAEQFNKTVHWNSKEKVFCDNETGITDAKKDLLLNKLLLAAIQLHTDRLNVEEKEGEAVVSTSTINSFSGECGVIKVWDHKTNAFSNADFVLFVSLDESEMSTRVCSQDLDQRPTSALIKFVPKDILDTRHFVRTAAHEIAHGLGFDVTRMQNYGKIRLGGLTSNTRAVHSDIMLEKMREHYDCHLHITGMYMEDEGDGRSKLHWERRIAKDELMSPYTEEPSGMYYTNLTLAAFHSLPFYSANFNMAEPMSWGNKSGCNLLDKTCDRYRDELMKYTSMFCDENEPVLQCTSDRFALGMCSSKSLPGNLPKVYHYFTKTAGQNEMTNGCPIVKPLKETTCESGDVALMPGSIVSKMSRCLNVDKPLEFSEGVQRNGVTVKGICAKVKCENGKVHVQYKGKEDTTEWIECKKDGHEITLEGSAFKGGSIVCPRYEEVCTGLNETDLPTIEYDDKSDNSNASEIPSPNVDSPEKNDSSEAEKAPQTEESHHPNKSPQEEDTQNAEIPSKEGGSSKPESPDNNDTTNIENGQDDHNTGNDLTDSKVENTN
ncbi:surface protease GP63, partial [Trypanosoma theileri]